MELDLSAEGAAVAAERYTQARSGVLSTPELGGYIDGLFDEVTKLLLENAELRSRLQRVESALCVAVSDGDTARASASLGRSA